MNSRIKAAIAKQVVEAAAKGKDYSALLTGTEEFNGKLKALAKAIQEIDEPAPPLLPPEPIPEDTAERDFFGEDDGYPEE